MSFRENKYIHLQSRYTFVGFKIYKHVMMIKSSKNDFTILM